VNHRHILNWLKAEIQHAEERGCRLFRPSCNAGVNSQAEKISLGHCPALGAFYRRLPARIGKANAVLRSSARGVDSWHGRFLGIDFERKLANFRV
jgi:hypothetical protein